MLLFVLAYLGGVRATARPSFLKAHADRLAHFATADRATRALPRLRGPARHGSLVRPAQGIRIEGRRT
jgi:hypothetical protein